MASVDSPTRQNNNSTLTPDGMYKCNVMPFDLCKVPTTVELMMDKALPGLKGGICVCYLDDVVEVSRGFDENLREFEVIFTSISNAG